MRPGTGPPEDRLRQATFERAETEEAWRKAILQAHKAGLTHRAIAPLAGISYQRVGQILQLTDKKGTR